MADEAVSATAALGAVDTKLEPAANAAVAMVELLRKRRRVRWGITQNLVVKGEMLRQNHRKLPMKKRDSSAARDIDLARWLCGVDYPSSVYCTGRRFTQGDAETPDTQLATFEFPEMLMTYEQTEFTPYMLRSDPGIRDGDIFPHWPQSGTRIELYGEQGMMCVGRMGGGWQVFVRTKDRQPVVQDEMHGRYPDPPHKENFVLSVKSRTRPNADIEEGHRSMLLVHYANISCRLGGRKLQIDPKTEHILDDPEAMKFFKRTYREPWVVEDVEP